MQFTFRTKIFLSIAIILILALAAVFFSNSYFINQQVGNVISKLIRGVYEDLNREQMRSVQLQVFQGAMFSSRLDLEGALLTYEDALRFDPSEYEQIGDVEPYSKEEVVNIAKATVVDTVISMLNRFNDKLEMDFFLLMDVNGTVLFDQGLSIDTNSETSLPVLQLIESESNNSPFIYNNDLYHGVIEPIFFSTNEENPNEILGYIITGFQMDSGFIRSIVNLESSDSDTDPGIGEIYVTFISPDHQIVASNISTSRNTQFTEEMMQHFQEHLTASTQDSSSFEFNSRGEEMTGFYWAMKNATDETIAYQLLLTSKTEATNAFLSNLITTIYIIGAITLLFGFLVGFITSKSVTKPVDILVNAANELSNGHLEYEIKYQSKDEMGFLSTTMEMMRKSILKRIQQIQSLQDELIQKEKLASIGSVASAINHEIRNQLSFGMAAELIRQKHPKDEQVQTYTQMILDARDYILRMLDDIRNFARANQKVEYSREAKPLKETLERTIAFCRFDKELKHVEIEEEYEDVGDVMCDHQRIGQVVINLIRNGGHAMEREGQLQVRLHTKENNVVIEVEDHGCGIPKENLEKIWESFFSTKGEKGLGLGLDICKKIIEDHQGKVYCESVVGTGTTFFVELPKIATE